MLKNQVIQAVARARTALQDLVLSATLLKRTQTDHVPGLSPLQNEESFEVEFVFTTFKEIEIDGDRIRATDRRGLIFPRLDGVVAEPNDVIQVGGLQFRVQMNEKVMAGDAVALSQVHLRPT